MNGLAGQQPSSEFTTAWDSDILRAYDTNRVVVLIKPKERQAKKTLLEVTNRRSDFNEVLRVDPTIGRARDICQDFPRDRDQVQANLERAYLQLTSYPSIEHFLLDVLYNQIPPGGQSNKETSAFLRDNFINSESQTSDIGAVSALIPVWQERFARSVFRNSKITNSVVVPLRDIPDSDADSSEAYWVVSGEWDSRSATFGFGEIIRTQRSPTPTEMENGLSSEQWLDDEIALLFKSSPLSQHDREWFETRRAISVEERNLLELSFEEEALLSPLFRLSDQDINFLSRLSPFLEEAHFHAFRRFALLSLRDLLLLKQEGRLQKDETVWFDMVQNGGGDSKAQTIPSIISRLSRLPDAAREAINKLINLAKPRRDVIRRLGAPTELEQEIAVNLRKPSPVLVDIAGITCEAKVLPSMLLRGAPTNGHMPGGGPGSFPYPIHRSYYEQIVQHKETIYPVTPGAHLPPKVRVYVLDTLYPESLEVQARNHPSVSAWYPAQNIQPGSTTVQIQRIETTIEKYVAESIWEIINSAGTPKEFLDVVLNYLGESPIGNDIPTQKKDLATKLVAKLKAEDLNAEQSDKLTDSEHEKIDDTLDASHLKNCVKIHETRRITKRFRNGRIYGNAQTFELFDHGPFVADIIYREAPDVEIVMVEALNRFGSGYLETFLAVMEWLVVDIENARLANKYCIVNCSFDFPLTEDFIRGIENDSLLDEFARLVTDYLTFVPVDFVAVGSSASVLTVTDVLYFAAAGNDSTGEGKDSENNPNRKDTCFPAILPGVFGIGALNERNDEAPRLARYSNTPDLPRRLAKNPSGGGATNSIFVNGTVLKQATISVPSFTTAPTNDPNRIVESFADDRGFCAFGGDIYIEPMDSTNQSVRVVGGVVGPYLGHIPQTPQGMVYQYAQWSGTSFATALATGIFARYVQTTEMERFKKATANKPRTNKNRAKTVYIPTPLTTHLKKFLDDRQDQRQRHGFSSFT